MEDVTDQIERPSPFTPDETCELVETAAWLLETQITDNPMLYIQPTFPAMVVYDVLAILQSQMYEVVAYEDLTPELLEIIDMALKLVYDCVAPPRQQERTSFAIDPAVQPQPIAHDMQAHIAALQAIPQPDQRTDAWYEFRYRYLTASSIWKAFFSESSRNQLIVDKCKPLDVGKYTSGGQSIESPMHWGHKYEPVSIQLYEERFQTHVSDFGCLPHPTIPYLAASPDGINTAPASPLYGRMLEVKNIFNREIDGIPKLEYWIQMQLQLEVCGLQECDFLETRFKEYNDLDEFLADTPPNSGSSDAYDRTSTGAQKGLMILFMQEGQQPLYKYAPFEVMRQQETAAAWEDAVMLEHQALTWVKNIYWRLDQLSCVLVQRNQLWFQAAMPVLDDLWQTIQHDKVHGYAHRLPNKRLNSTSSSSSSTLSVDTSTGDGDEEGSSVSPVDKRYCMINISL